MLHTRGSAELDALALREIPQEPEMLSIFHAWVYSTGQRPPAYNLPELPPLIIGTLSSIVTQASALAPNSVARLNIEDGKDGVNLNTTAGRGEVVDALEAIRADDPTLTVIPYGLMATDPYWLIGESTYSVLEERNKTIAEDVEGLVDGIGIDLYFRFSGSDLVTYYPGLNKSEAETFFTRASARIAVREAVRCYPGLRHEGWTSSRPVGAGDQTPFSRATAHFAYVRQLPLRSLIVLEGFSDTLGSVPFNDVDANLANYWQTT
jgi:hypothetical protein